MNQEFTCYHSQGDANMIDPVPLCRLCVSLKESLEKAASEYLRTRNELQGLPENDDRRSKAALAVRRSRETSIQAVRTFNQHKKRSHPE